MKSLPGLAPAYRDPSGLPTPPALDLLVSVAPRLAREYFALAELADLEAPGWRGQARAKLNTKRAGGRALSKLAREFEAASSLLGLDLQDVALLVFAALAGAFARVRCQGEEALRASSGTSLVCQWHVLLEVVEETLAAFWRGGLPQRSIWLYARALSQCGHYYVPPALRLPIRRAAQLEEIRLRILRTSHYCGLEDLLADLGRAGVGADEVRRALESVVTAKLLEGGAS